MRYTIPWRAILFDVDGTLTGMGAGGWAVPYWEHLI
jgi:phosphoglycolate phosphatase-like HAD superfamily hydrolase